MGNSVAGYELALLPGADPADGVLTYWGVADVQRKVDELIAAEAVVHNPPADVGDGITTVAVPTPDGTSSG